MERNGESLTSADTSSLCDGQCQVENCRNYLKGRPLGMLAWAEVENTYPLWVAPLPGWDPGLCELRVGQQHAFTALCDLLLPALAAWTFPQ